MKKLRDEIDRLSAVVTPYQILCDLMAELNSLAVDKIVFNIDRNVCVESQEINLTLSMIVPELDDYTITVCEISSRLSGYPVDLRLGWESRKFAAHSVDTLKDRLERMIDSTYFTQLFTGLLAQVK